MSRALKIAGSRDTALLRLVFLQDASKSGCSVTKFAMISVVNIETTRLMSSGGDTSVNSCLKASKLKSGAAIGANGKKHWLVLILHCHRWLIIRFHYTLSEK